MNKHAKNLRRTRADMLGTDDEEHYWECHDAAAEIERLEADYAALLDEVEQLRGDLEIMRLQRNATHCSRCPECAKEFVVSYGSNTGERQ